MSMRMVLAVLASCFVTPDSFRIFPKKNIPSSGNAPGAMKAVSRRPTSENAIFSNLETDRGGFIRMSLSFLVVSNFMMGGWISGISAM